MVSKSILTIKNMVCPRCIKVVREELENMGLTVKSISLGSVTVKEDIDQKIKDKIATVLLGNGFELLEDKNAELIEKIKVEIIS